VKIIQEIGGLQFLNSLKENLYGSEADLIEKIIERLLEVSAANNESVATTTSNYVKKFPSISTTATTFMCEDVDEATPRNPSITAIQSIKDCHSYQQIGRLSLGVSADPSVNDYSNYSRNKQTTLVETSQIGNVFSQTINSQDLNSQIKIALNGN
jgi:hypothetical protein